MERRKYERFPVEGKANFWMTTEPAKGEVLDIGSGGVLIRTDVLVPQGARLTVQFKVNGCDRTFMVNARVIRAQMDVLAVMFLEKVEGLEELLQQLKQKQQEAEARFRNLSPGRASTGD